MSSPKLLFRGAVTAGLLWFLLTQIDGAELSAALTQVAPGYFLGALLALFAIRLCNAWRLVRVASKFNVELGLHQAIAMIFSSTLAGSVLPGGIGTDVVRGLQLNALYQSKSFAAASVLIDRYLGVLSMLAVGVVALQFVTLPFPWYFDAFVYAAFAGCVTFWLLGGRVLTWLPEGSNWIGKGRDFAVRVHGALQDGQGIGVLLGVSLLIQLLRCLVMLLTFRAFGLDVAAASVFAFVPVLFIFVIAPISLGGLGVREGLLVLFFVPLGAAIEPLIVIGFASHLLEILASLPGAWYLFRGLPRAAPPEIGFRAG